MGIIKSKEWKENRLRKTDQRLRDPYDTIKQTNIFVIEVSEKKGMERGRIRETFGKIDGWKLPKFGERHKY